MKRFTRTDAVAFLQGHGIKHPSHIDEIMSGFDLTRPLYEHLLQFDDELFQYVRNPSAGHLDAAAGNWFCLAGASRGGLAIIDGLAGRQLHTFKVVAPFAALEGTAAKVQKNWQYSIGGVGGATQLYVPARFIGHLQSAGAVLST